MSEPIQTDDDKREIAEAVRQACIQAALDAYEQAGLAGMCAEGRWEMAMDALQTLRLDPLLKQVQEPQPEKK